jgi:glutathione S-transferase
MSKLKLYQLFGSPNNTKVRLALGFLGLDYERVDVDPMDRATIVAASGQPLTPALVDGDIRMFDSSAILRYLDANRSRGARLFSEDAEVLHEIEAWEQKTRGGGFAAPIGMLFRAYFSPEHDEALLAEAASGFEDRCRAVEEALGDADYLVDERLTAADCSVVPILNFGAPTDSFRRQAASELGDFIMGHLNVPDDCPGVRAYIERVMAFDA